MTQGTTTPLQLATEQPRDNSEAMHLLLDISSRLQATEAYIARKEEAEADQTPARLARASTSSLQLSCELPMGQEGRGAAKDITEAVRKNLARHLRWAPLLADSTLDNGTDSEENLDQNKYCRNIIQSGKVYTANSTLVMGLSWPHELNIWHMGNSEGKPEGHAQTPHGAHCRHGYILVEVNQGLPCCMAPAARE